VPARPKEFEGCSIVALGSFNPAIFHPQWFVRNGLIREQEGADANLQVTHNEAAIFSTPWFTLQATKDQFVIGSEDPTTTQSLRDLAMGTFAVLDHTPIRSYGFNRYTHSRMESEEAWHELGHFLAPKQAWESVLEKPGMKSLTTQGTKEGMGADVILIRIEPSTRVTPGVFLHVNFHRGRESEKLSPVEAMARFQKALNDDWNPFLAYTDRVADKLFASFDNRPR
jgi:hypothetical protein